MWNDHDHRRAWSVLLLRTRTSGRINFIECAFLLSGLSRAWWAACLVRHRAGGTLGQACVAEHDRVFPPSDRSIRKTLSREDISQQDQLLCTSEQTRNFASSRIVVRGKHIRYRSETPANEIQIAWEEEPKNCYPPDSGHSGLKGDFLIAEKIK